MNRGTAYDIKEKYGEEAYLLALEIMDKEHAISYWTDKKNVAQHYIEQNKDKIKKIQVKLDQAKKHG